MQIGIIIGTNRTDAFTQKIALHYQNLLIEKGQSSQIIDLNTLPQDFPFTALYQNSGKNTDFNAFQAAVDQCDKLFILAPEYNGSYPGILKTFIDGLRHPDTFSSKKIALVGLSSGVLGNAVGLGHLNDVLSYLNANVLGLRIKLGEIHKHYSEGKIVNETYAKFIDKQINNFLTF
jgi:chromate reductase, NAD(P)H dehydrogenase (quinone)